MTTGTNDVHIKMPGFKVNRRDPRGAGDALTAIALKYITENKMNKTTSQTMIP